MLILSPTKKMKLIHSVNKDRNIFFEEHAKHLRLKVSKLSKEELASKMKIRNQVLEDTENYYNATSYYLSYQVYDGIAFKQINNIDPGNKKLADIYILSALYGMTNALDQIKPYRLDFTMTKIFDFNLYKFWYPKVNLKIKELNPKFILDLSSKEFSKLIDKSKLANYYFVEFDQKYNSSFLKKARGHLAFLYLNDEIKAIKDYENISNEVITKIVINENKLIVTLNLEAYEKTIS